MLSKFNELKTRALAVLAKPSNLSVGQLISLMAIALGVTAIIAVGLSYKVPTATQKPEDSGASGDTSSRIELQQGDVLDANGLSIPVVMGDRIVVDTTFPVKDSEITLNVVQQISDSNFKVNYSDTHYVSQLSEYKGFLFLPSGEPETTYIQLVFPTDNEVVDVLTSVFADISNLVVEEHAISFQSTGLTFSGEYAKATAENNEEWYMVSIIQGEEPDNLVRNWLAAMVESLGPYYSREFARPVAIEGDIVDRTMVIDSQNLIIPAPRTGVEEINNYETYATWTLSNSALYGTTQFVAVTSSQDIFGPLEALEYIKGDIEQAYAEIMGLDAVSYIITSRTAAMWANVDAYYMEGTLNGERIISYVFYNPAKNNYSTLSCVSGSSSTGANCEKLLNAISERISFYKGVI